jgi:hypothetical protein
MTQTALQARKIKQLGDFVKFFTNRACSPPLVLLEKLPAIPNRRYALSSPTDPIHMSIFTLQSHSFSPVLANVHSYASELFAKDSVLGFSPIRCSWRWWF